MANISEITSGYAEINFDRVIPYAIYDESVEGNYLPAVDRWCKVIGGEGGIVNVTLANVQANAFPSRGYLFRARDEVQQQDRFTDDGIAWEVVDTVFLSREFVRVEAVGYANA